MEISDSGFYTSNINWNIVDNLYKSAKQQIESVHTNQKVENLDLEDFIKLWAGYENNATVINIDSL